MRRAGHHEAPVALLAADLAEALEAVGVAPEVRDLPDGGLAVLGWAPDGTLGRVDVGPTEARLTWTLGPAGDPEVLSPEACPLDDALGLSATWLLGWLTLTPEAPSSGPEGTSWAR
jgi:hypothetical protein